MNVENIFNRLSSKKVSKSQGKTNSNSFLTKKFQMNSSRRGSLSSTTKSFENGNNLFSKNKLDSKTKSGAVYVMNEASDSAESLKHDLERIKAGIALLNQSIDKLNEVLLVENGCCGNICDSIGLSFFTNRPIESSRAKYNRLDNSTHGDIDEYSYSSGLLSSANKSDSVNTPRDRNPSDNLKLNINGFKSLLNDNSGKERKVETFSILSSADDE